MKFFSITTFSVFLFLPVFFSCSVSKPTYYFKDIKRDTVINNTAFNLGELKIKNTDILNISISSLSREEDELFATQPLSTASATSTASAATAPGFPVDINGNIHLHKLGKVKAEGMTRSELKNSLEKQLQPYLKDPVVVVNFANHHITVIGEVGKPQLLSMPDERMTIMDVVAQSGNINAIAELNNLMVIREKDQSSKEFKHINLEDKSIFTSPWYYLQPNDVVVVNPDEKRATEEKKRTAYQQTGSIILQALSIVIIITQILKK
jgi:polysaccharide export outer membrane protein